MRKSQAGAPSLGASGHPLVGLMRRARSSLQVCPRGNCLSPRHATGGAGSPSPSRLAGGPPFPPAPCGHACSILPIAFVAARASSREARRVVLTASCNWRPAVRGGRQRGHRACVGGSHCQQRPLRHHCHDVKHAGQSWASLCLPPEHGSAQLETRGVVPAVCYRSPFRP